MLYFILLAIFLAYISTLPPPGTHTWRKRKAAVTHIGQWGLCEVLHNRFVTISSKRCSCWPAGVPELNLDR